jgi:hypothetical protein
MEHHQCENYMSPWTAFCNNGKKMECLLFLLRSEALPNHWCNFEVRLWCTSDIEMSVRWLTGSRHTWNVTSSKVALRLCVMAGNKALCSATDDNLVDPCWFIPKSCHKDILEQRKDISAGEQNDWGRKQDERIYQKKLDRESIREELRAKTTPDLFKQLDSQGADMNSKHI